MTKLKQNHCLNRSKESLPWITRIIILSLGFGFAADIQAKLYHFELIVVSHISAQNLGEYQDIEKQIAVPASPDIPEAAPLLPSSPYLLNKEQTTLDQNDKYHTLLHLAWEQPVSPGQVYDIPLSNEAIDETADLYPLHGRMRIRLDHYFDISFHLTLSIPVEHIEKILAVRFPNHTSAWAYFPLSQVRRMRSNELNYIDSPLYGVLIKIFPVEDEKL